MEGHIRTPSDLKDERRRLEDVAKMEEGRELPERSAQMQFESELSYFIPQNAMRNSTDLS